MKPPQLVSLVVSALLLILWAAVFMPNPRPGDPPGPYIDAYDYVYGADALLHGHYTVTYDGPPRVPQYPPGMAFLLSPLVAAGGIDAARWFPFAASIILGTLVAFLVFRLDRPLAAPLAVALVLYSGAIMSHADMVMSDVPATLALLAVAAILPSRSPLGALGTGLLVGSLPLLRTSFLPLSLAALGAIAVRPNRAFSLLAALPPLAFNTAWSLLAHGTLLTGGYRAGDGVISLGYVVGPPASMDVPKIGGAGEMWQLPNALSYPLRLAGIDGFLGWPLVGVFGLVALVVFARRSGPIAIFARLGLAALVISLLTYLPYYHQSGRFLLPAATFLNLGAALGVANLLARTRR